MLSGQHCEQSLVNLSLFVVEYIIEHLLVLERIENFNVIINLTGIGVRNFPKETFTNILGILTKLY